jgi:PhzF family phenazine biosynthesis protein
MKFDIYQVDAFAEKVFEGNPAAVIPLQSWLPAEVMQKIAMENNLSETAFIVKSETELGGSPEGSYHIRWFTPKFEIDLCGHATLASAYIIKNFLEPQVSECIFTTEKAGELKTYTGDGKYTLDFPSRMPKPAETPAGLLDSLGISNAIEILRSRDYFVVLPDEEAVKNIEPDFELMKQIETVGVIVTAKGKTADVVSRCFYPSAGIPEDPVTGSAHCNIVPYWSQKLSKTKLHCSQVSERGGNMNCELQGDRVLMTGKCVLFMQGEIDVSGYL